MKKIKILKTVLIILIIILISIIGFVGIYVQDKNTIKNLVPEYLLGKDLKGYRRVELEVSEDKETFKYDAEGKLITDESSETPVANTVEKKANEDEVLTVENYEKTKKVLEKRLSKMNVADYLISLNKETGKIAVDIPENDNTDSIVYELMYQGKFEIVDKDSNELLLDNNDLKNVKAGYGAGNDNVTSIFINFQFDKEGTKKFEDITKTYVKTVIEKEETEEESKDETTEESENKEDKTETITREVVIKLDDQELLSTYFDNVIKNGLLQLSFGSSSTLSTEEMQDRLIEANNMAILLDNEKTPVKYELTQNRFVNSDITIDQIKVAIEVLVVILGLMVIYLIVRYRVRGVKGAFSLVGYLATLLIAVRIFNVEMSINGITAIALSTLFSFMLIQAITIKKQTFWEIMRKYSLIFVPSIIIGIVFTLTNIPGGAVLFWGILTNAIYNMVITKFLLDDKN